MVIFCSFITHDTWVRFQVQEKIFFVSCKRWKKKKEFKPETYCDKTSELAELLAFLQVWKKKYAKIEANKEMAWIQSSCMHKLPN